MTPHIARAPREYFKSLGEETRKARIASGMTREDLACTSRLHVNTIGALERGEVDVSVLTENRILSSLGCSSMVFFKDGVGLVFGGPVHREPERVLLSLPDALIVGIIGGELRRIRRERSLTLEELASEIGVHRNTLWNYERGLVVPSGSAIFRLYLSLGVSRISPSSEGLGAELIN